MELELTIEAKDTRALSTERLPIAGRLVLGRGPESPVALDGPLISREHIAFDFQDGRLSVEDLSANGSWLNGGPLARGRKYEVTEADVVQLPGYEMRCAILGASASSEAQPEGASTQTPMPTPAKAPWWTISGMEVVVLLTVLAAGGLVWIFWSS